jgi:hypothetical protein
MLRDATGKLTKYGQKFFNKYSKTLDKYLAQNYIFAVPACIVVGILLGLMGLRFIKTSLFFFCWFAFLFILIVTLHALFFKLTNFNHM